MTFVPYESFQKKFGGMEAGHVVTRDEIEENESRQFVHETSQLVNETAESSENRKFKIEPQVAEQLHLNQKEKDKIEIGVREGIERRWIVAKEKAEVQGFTAGLEQGKKDAYLAEKPKIEQMIEGMQTVMHSIQEASTDIYRSNENFLIQLIGQIAKTIVLKEVQVDREHISRLVINLLERLNQKNNVRILVSEGDFKSVENLHLAIERHFGELKNIQIEPSDSVSVGGCRIDSSVGVIDASIEQQIENVINGLYKGTD